MALTAWCVFGIAIIGTGTRKTVAAGGRSCPCPRTSSWPGCWNTCRRPTCRRSAATGCTRTTSRPSWPWPGSGSARRRGRQNRRSRGGTCASGPVTRRRRSAPSAAPRWCWPAGSSRAGKRLRRRPSRAGKRPCPRPSHPRPKWPEALPAVSSFSPAATPARPQSAPRGETPAGFLVRTRALPCRQACSPLQQPSAAGFSAPPRVFWGPARVLIQHCPARDDGRLAEQSARVQAFCRWPAASSTIGCS